MFLWVIGAIFSWSTIFCLGHNHHNHFHFLIALLQIQSKSVNLIFSRWELCKDTVVIIHILVMDQTLGNVMVPMKGHTTKNKERSATNVTLYLLGQAVWGNIWKHTLEKNQTNATSVTLHHLEKAIWVSIWKRIVEKRHTIATSVTTHPLEQLICYKLYKCKHASMPLLSQVLWTYIWK